LKVDSVFAEVAHAGRQFQRRGAATPKARSPAVDSRDLRMTSLLDEADRSRVLEQSSAAHCKYSARYLSSPWARNTKPSTRGGGMIMVFFYECMGTIHRVQEKKRPQFSVHYFNKSGHSFVIFGMNHTEGLFYYENRKFIPNIIT